MTLLCAYIQPPLTPLCLDKCGSKPHCVCLSVSVCVTVCVYVCVCVCVCVWLFVHQSLYIRVLHRASGKSFLGQTCHSNKCGHHTLARYFMDGRQTEWQQHTDMYIPHINTETMQTLQDTCTDRNTQTHAWSLTGKVNGLIDFFARKLIRYNVKG